MSGPSPRAVIPHRMPEFDAVRGIAALMVMWAHTWQGSGLLHPGLGWYASLRWGTLALDLFFALSGFLITGILLDQRDHPRYYSLFYARRALKILPLLYLVLIVEVGFVLPWFGIEIGWVQVTGILFYVGNLLIVFGPGLPPPLNITWSLAVEEQFYMVAPLVMRRFRPGQIGALVLGIVVLGVALRAWGWHNGLGAHWAHFFTLTHFDGLALGSLVAVGVHTGFLDGARLRRIGVAAFFGVAAVHLYRRALPTGFLSIGIDQLLDAVFATSVTMLIVGSREGSLFKRFLNTRPLIFLGTISYGIYLYHALVICILTRGFTISHPEVPFLVQYAIVVTLSTAIAWVSWIGFEEPVLRLKRYVSYTRSGASVRESSRPRPVPTVEPDAHGSPTTR